jgi:endonuclease I
MYSDIPGGTTPYEFTFITDKCGSYQNEGDCYNREHSFPQSWFNKASPMKSDLFHVYPTDGKVNGYRSSYPYGEVSNPTWTSQNGSKLGANTTPGYTGKVFEPIDEYKGDFARTYFYMATRYYTEDAGWKNNAAVNGSQMKPWELNTLYQWHLQDTVSQKEIDRNNAVYGIQHNRNPFIDHPEWVDSIWFDDTSIENIMENIFVNVYPNPAKDNIEIKINSPKVYSWQIEIYNMQGSMILSSNFDKNNYHINISNLSKGIYFIKLHSTDNNLLKSIKWIKQ